MYEPQALKCKLYGLKPLDGNEFTETENAKFRDHIKDKLFKVKFIQHTPSEDDLFEITLNEESRNKSVHDYLITNKLGKLKYI